MIKLSVFRKNLFWGVWLMKERGFFNYSQFFGLLPIILTVCSNISIAQEPWTPIFDGNSLTGWVQRGGIAKFEVENGTIKGTSVLDSPNSFLCTNKKYSDFILELEFKVDPLLNSGVQIRSNSYPEYKNGRVHGYQVEIDPSERRWTGGIFDEARRGWLHPLDNEEAKKAFKQNQWNKFRIEAIGDTIKTWLNNTPVSYLNDDMTKCGFIGLQVHGISKDKKKEGLSVYFKNIRIITKEPEKHSMQTTLPASNMYNKLTEKEIRQGWKLLFDGKSTAGWRAAKLDKFPEYGWEVKDGLLTVLESGGSESRHGGDIVTIDKYSDFEFCVDFKLTPGANSGIKYYVDTELNKGKGSSIGLEYQLLDDKLHPDAKRGNHEGSRTLASLYDLIKAENKHSNPVGHWNHARIISKDNHVEHWLNGRKVLEYERRSEAYRKLVSESKYKIWPAFGELDKGNILLQDHGNRVSFRNIKIRDLKE
jgi:hypothetical protein